MSRRRNAGKAGPMTSARVALAELESFSDEMSHEEAERWFKHVLGRVPETPDFYKTGRDLYTLGRYRAAMICLELYGAQPNAQVDGQHLLGYCYTHLGLRHAAIGQFRETLGPRGARKYENNWQMVVELGVELEEKGGSAPLPAASSDGYFAADGAEGEDLYGGEVAPVETGVDVAAVDAPLFPDDVTDTASDAVAIAPLPDFVAETAPPKTRRASIVNVDLDRDYVPLVTEEDLFGRP